MNVYNWDEDVTEKPSEELDELDEAILSYMREQAMAGLNVKYYNEVYGIRFTTEDYAYLEKEGYHLLDKYVKDTYPEVFI